ncbi:acetyl-CoA carboxylase biotin carboxyl carrier protein [Pseudonocardia spinosispora]|uniref:acetyl-CoA carboxylase biotin carboxyl carrier protein n=1 Tax=Pseudonocardia spinosispora TaxID=103441 RepID=UPI0004009F76|nr:biotin/lipoyl-containing protein [Pseudonocardia spinosispora]
MTGIIDRHQHEASEEGTPDRRLLAEVRASVLELMTRMPTLPKRVRVTAREVAVEVEWPETGRTSESDAPGWPVLTASALAQQPSTTGHQLTAPTVGTFYRSPEPGAQPFVEVGDTVRAGDQVAILEAMKLMLPVDSDIAGTVVAIMKDDGEPVEYGEPLIVVEPTDPE